MADNGTIAYAPRHRAAQRIGSCGSIVRWQRQPLELPQGLFFDPRFSPDGTRVAVVWQTLTAGNGDIWVSDLRAETFTGCRSRRQRLSPSGRPTARRSTTSSIDPSGRRTTIMRKPADGSREAESDRRDRFTRVSEGGHAGWALRAHRLRPVAAAGVGRGVEAGVGRERQAGVARGDGHSTISPVAWSPDRRWLAYQSDESGRAEDLRARHVRAPAAAGRSRRPAARSHMVA